MLISMAFEFVNSLPKPETLTTRTEDIVHLSHRTKVLPVIEIFRSSRDFVQVQRVLREAQVHLGRVENVCGCFLALLSPTVIYVGDIIVVIQNESTWYPYNIYLTLIQTFIYAGSNCIPSLSDRARRQGCRASVLTLRAEKETLTRIRGRSSISALNQVTIGRLAYTR
jgi:hypothetical protein